MYLYLCSGSLLQVYRNCLHELEAVQKHKIIAQHESHIALPVIWNAVYAQILLLTLTNLSNGLHDEMGIIPTAIMKDY